MACKALSHERGRLAWFSFLHHPWLGAVRFFFFVETQEIRRLLKQYGRIWG